MLCEIRREMSKPVMAPAMAISAVFFSTVRFTIALCLSFFGFTLLAHP